MIDSVNNGCNIDRRIEQMPVDKERRIDERLSVLETKIDFHQTSLDSQSEDLKVLIERFDSHVVEEISTTQSIQVALVKVTSTVDNLASEMSRTNTNLEKFAKALSPTITTVNKWSTSMKTLRAIASALIIITAGGWAVFTFAVSHVELTTK